jgi:hypothetical protein
MRKKRGKSALMFIMFTSSMAFSSDNGFVKGFRIFRKRKSFFHKEESKNILMMKILKFKIFFFSQKKPESSRKEYILYNEGKTVQALHLQATL